MEDYVTNNAILFLRLGTLNNKVIFQVNRVVAPKKAKLAAAEREFAETMALLTKKRNEVARLEEQLRILNEKLEEAINEQTRLQASVNLCNDKLFRAKKLIGG